MLKRRSFTLSSIGAMLTGRTLMSSAQAAEGNKIFEVTKTAAEWKKALTPAQFHVLREHGTERPFTSPLNKNYDAGTYGCAGCDLPLFFSEAKFDSKTGWPSFTEPLQNAIGTSEDRQLFMLRVEVHCRRCGGHLGHVFEDGPKPTGLRYCMNGVAMKFAPKEKTAS